MSVGPGGGLYSSVYGGVNHANKGIFNVLFSGDGSFSPVKRTDLRLAGYELGQEATPVVTAATATDASKPSTSAHDVKIPPSTSDKIADLMKAGGSPLSAFFVGNWNGIPYWLMAIFALGFVYSYRQKKKSLL